VRRFFDKYKGVIVWVMVIGFFLGAAVATAFRYTRPTDSGQGKDSSEVALVIGEETISKDHFDNAYQNTLDRQKALYQQFGRDLSSKLEGASGALYKLRLKTQVARSLVKETILQQEAEERGIKPKSSEVDRRLSEQIDRILNSRNWSKKDLEAVLEEQGLSYKEFTKNLKNNIRSSLKRERITRQIEGEVNPSEEELQTYLGENIDSYIQTPARVKASHLVFELQTKAKQVASGLRQGELSFESLAEESEAETDLGWFSKEEKSGAIADTAFSLKEGEISDPIATRSGWEVIRLEGKKPAQTPSLQAVRDEVNRDYVEKEKGERFDKWYEEKRDQTEVELKLPLVRAQMKAEESTEKGIDAFKSLKEEGFDDTYLGYYLGRLYQQKLEDLKKKSSDEEDKDQEDETGDKKEEGETELQKEIDQLKEKAVSNYMDTLEKMDERDQKLLQRILGLDQQNYRANYYLAELNAAKKRFSQARFYYKKAIEQNSDFVLAYVGYGDMLQEVMDYGQAAEQYKKALQLGDDSTAVRNKLGRAYMEAGEMKKAEETFQKVLDENSENFNALKNMGDLRFREEKYEQASSHYEKALEVSSDPQVRLNLGKSYLRMDKLDKAKLELEGLLASRPYMSEAYLVQGDVYAELGRQEKALSYYRDGLARTRDSSLKTDLAKKILSYKPEDLSVRFTLADAYRDGHIYDAAIEEYGKILEGDSSEEQKMDAYLGIARSFMKKTDYGKAQEYYEKGLDFAEKTPDRLEFYQGILNAAKSRKEEGEELSQAGLRALLEISDIYVGQGKDEKARENLKQIKSIDPEFEQERVAELLSQVQPAEETTAETQTPSAKAETESGSGQ